jgi:uroporphyrinogen-III decarboxylase
MPGYQDLVSYIRDPLAPGVIPAIWDFAPCHASLVGGIEDLRRYYLCAEYKADVQERLKAAFPTALILPGTWPDLGVIVEASAFGGRIVWPAWGAPNILPSLSEIRQIDRLRPPVPEEAGLLPLYIAQLLEMRKYLKSRGSDVDPVISSMGPTEIAGLILGYEPFYLNLHLDPVRIHALLDLLTEFIVGWLRLQAKTMGEVQLLIVGDHVPHQVCPEHVEEFILPRMRAIFQSFPGLVKLYHNEGFHSVRHIELMQRVGFDIWHFGSDQHQLNDLYPQLDQGICLFGGLNPHGVLRTGTPEQVREESLTCLKEARGRKLLLSSGTGTTPDVPAENVMTMVQSARLGS